MIKVISQDQLSVIWAENRSTHKLDFPFYAYPWHVLWWKFFGRDWRPFILLINDVAIAPLARRGDLVIFSGGQEIADYLDLIAPENAKEHAWQEIMKFIELQGVKQLELFNLPQNSKTISFFRKLNAVSKKIILTKEDTTPIIALPGNWEQYLLSLDRHNRHELRRKLKRFESDHPDVSFGESQNPDHDLEILINLMKLNTEKNIFLTRTMETFFRRLPATFPGTLKIFTLKIGDQTVAAVLTFVSGKSLLTYNSGYDKTNYPGAGFYLKASTIRWAMENGLKEYNFLQGNERYKYDLGGVDFFVYRIKVTLD